MNQQQFQIKFFASLLDIAIRPIIFLTKAAVIMYE